MQGRPEGPKVSLGLKFEPIIHADAAALRRDWREVADLSFCFAGLGDNSRAL